MDRREFMRLGAGTAGLLVVGGTAAACAPEAATPTSAFPQGVAAGLHSEAAVVLWTRVEPVVVGADTVTWSVSTTADMTTVVATGSAPVLASADHTVKVLVEGLDPDRSHWYRFDAGGVLSPVGRARTLPSPGAPVESLRLAFASCQSFATGWYGAWRDVAARDVDAVVYLGDYIYEAPTIQIPRRIRDEPLFEARTLDQYRTKYRHYRSDPDLQAAHAAHPWAVVWDDHELHNDWDRSVHTEEPGRFEAASRAWFEYQPVWPTDGTRIHRSFRWGRLGEIMMLDSRQYRDPAVPSIFGGGFMGPDAAAADRTMLGPAQRAWLLDGLSAADTEDVRWKIIGNPQPIAPLRVLDLDTPELRAANPGLVKHAGLYFGMESWDGFPAERDMILEHLRANGIGGTTFLSGDVHAFFASGLRSDYDDDTSPIVAHDFAGGAISSPSGGPHTALVDSGTRLTPDYDFVDGNHNGYGLVEYTPDSATVTFMGLNPIWRSALPKPIYTTSFT